MRTRPPETGVPERRLLDPASQSSPVGYPRDGGGVVRLATPDWPQKIGVDVIPDDIMCRLRPRLDPQKPPKNQIFHYIETLNVANNPCMEY